MPEVHVSMLCGETRFKVKDPALLPLRTFSLLDEGFWGAAFAATFSAESPLELPAIEVHYNLLAPSKQKEAGRAVP